MFNLKYTINEKTIKYLVAPILFGVNIGWIVIVLIDRPMARRLVNEDGAIEWLQFIFLIFTAFYCLRIVMNDRKLYNSKLIKHVFLTCFILTLILAFEEISWGQRILDIETPDAIKQINAQNEITLHNHVYFQRYRHWLLLLFGFVGLTLIHLKTHKYKIDEQVLFFSPPAFFRFAYGLIVISGITLEVAYIFLHLSTEPLVNQFRFWAGRSTEIGELGVSMTAFSYAAYKFNTLLLKKA